MTAATAPAELQPQRPNPDLEADQTAPDAQQTVRAETASGPAAQAKQAKSSAAPSRSSKPAASPPAGKSKATRPEPRQEQEGENEAEGVIQRELQAAIDEQTFMNLQDMLKEDAGNSVVHRKALHVSYLAAIKAGRIFGVPLTEVLSDMTDNEADNSAQKIPDEMVAVTPTFTAWRAEANCAYYSGQMQKEASFGISKEFAQQHFLTLATARVKGAPRGR